LKSSLNKARASLRKPNWLTEDVWDNLCQHWGSKPFKVKILVAKANRTSDSQGFGISLHIVGSISTSQHGENMVTYFAFYFKESNKLLALYIWNKCPSLFVDCYPTTPSVLYYNTRIVCLLMLMIILK